MNAFLSRGALLLVLLSLVAANNKELDTVSIQPDGEEFGDMDFGSIFGELLKNPDLASLMGNMMGGLGGSGNGLGALGALGPLLQGLSNPEHLMKHAEDFLGTNPMNLLEKFSDPKLMDEMLEHVGNHELFQHLEEGNLGEAMKKLMDVNYMEKFAQDMHSHPSVQEMVGRVSSDPDIKRVVEKVSSGEHLEKVQDILENSGLSQVLGQMGGEGGMQAIVQQMMQGGDLSKMLGGDMGKMLGQMLGQGNLDLGSLMKGLNPSANAPSDAPKEGVPDLHKFASLVDTLGGLDKVAAMMKEMGMEEMLERAGGVAALEAVVNDAKLKKNQA